MPLSLKPKRRSRLRRWLGRHYFICKRLISWYTSDKHFALRKQQTRLPHLVIKHHSPLYRQLRGVDMWLQENKVINLTLATAQINDLIIQPGETFSLWRLIGRPTARKGYQKGMVLSEGSFYAATGGGLCQLANLLYWLTLHTPLIVTERWRHNYDVFPDNNRTQPFGSGATIAYNYIDLQINNPTTSTYQLAVWLDESQLHGACYCNQPSFYTYKIYEATHSITQEWWGGYMRHNVVRRKVFNEENVEVDDEFVVENHAIMMYEPLLTSAVNKE